LADGEILGALELRIDLRLGDPTNQRRHPGHGDEKADGDDDEQYDDDDDNAHRADRSTASARTGRWTAGRARQVWGE